MVLPAKMSQMSQKQSESNANARIRPLSECRHHITMVFAYSHSDQPIYNSVLSSLDTTHFSHLWPRNTHVFSTFIPCWTLFSVLLKHSSNSLPEAWRKLSSAQAMQFFNIGWFMIMHLHNQYGKFVLHSAVDKPPLLNFFSWSLM